MTPDNVQEILDEDIDGKNIIFSYGYYSTIYLRPSKNTATINISNTNGYVGDQGVFDNFDRVGDVSTVSEGTYYHYFRTYLMSNF